MKSEGRNDNEQSADGHRAGNDSNNYLDLRNELHSTDQGTLRVDHDFSNGSTVFVRYSAQREHGFMPENLPGFGYFHDNLGQQGVLGLVHVISPRIVNTTTLAISRLSMNHTTESANNNDIVSELGIQGVGYCCCSAESKTHTSAI